MPIVIPVQVDVPPTFVMTPDMISAEVNRYAQYLTDNLVSQQSSLPLMSYEELDQCIPLDVAFDRLRDKARSYYAES